MSHVTCPQKTVFLFLGPPGSGKGTLAARCVMHAEIPVLSTGNVSRQHVAEGTSLGKKLAPFLAEGQLIPDALIVELVTSWLDQQLKKSASVILDGFPRTVGQAEVLLQYAHERSDSVTLCPIFFEVSDAVVLQRLLSRRICSNRTCQMPYSDAQPERSAGVCDRCGSELTRRADDSMHTIQRRLSDYRHTEGFLQSFFKTHGYNPPTIDASNHSPDAIFRYFITEVRGRCDKD